jgi:hypothetical protein
VCISAQHQILWNRASLLVRLNSSTIGQSTAILRVQMMWGN